MLEFIDGRQTDAFNMIKRVLPGSGITLKNIKVKMKVALYVLNRINNDLINNDLSRKASGKAKEAMAVALVANELQSSKKLSSEDALEAALKEAVENAEQKKAVDKALQAPLRTLQPSGNPAAAVFSRSEWYGLSKAGTFDEFLAWLKKQTGDGDNIEYRVKFFGGNDILYRGSEQYNGTVIQGNEDFERYIKMGFSFYVERLFPALLKGLSSLEHKEKEFLVKDIKELTSAINTFLSAGGFGNLHGVEYDLFILNSQEVEIDIREDKSVELVKRAILDGKPVMIRRKDDKGRASGPANPKRKRVRGAGSDVERLLQLLETISV